MKDVIEGLLRLAYRRLDVNGLCRYIDESSVGITDDFSLECLDTLYEAIVESDKLFKDEPYHKLARLEQKRILAAQQAHTARLSDSMTMREAAYWDTFDRDFYYYLDLIDIRKALLLGSGRIGNEDSSKSVDYIHSIAVRLTKERLAKYVS